MSILCATARIEAAAGLQEQEGRFQIGQVRTSLDQARVIELWFDPRDGTISAEPSCGCSFKASLAPIITPAIVNALQHHDKGARDGS